jgi:hypothetical protein
MKKKQSTNFSSRKRRKQMMNKNPRKEGIFIIPCCDESEELRREAEPMS